MPRYDVAKEGDIANMLNGLGDSSDDEFPEVDVVIRRYRHNAQARPEERSCDNDTDNTTPKKKPISQVNRNVSTKSNPAAKATPLRRRKLGQSQTADASLLKPWEDTVLSKEKISRAPKSTGSRTRVREIKPLSNAANDPSKPLPANSRQATIHMKPSNISLSVESEEEKSTKKNNTRKDTNMKNEPAKQALKKPARPLTPEEESDEEQDLLKDRIESSEDEYSEFVSISGSESDTWNSDSESSMTQPTRRSQSPTIEWAKPQRASFKIPGKESSLSDKQPKTNINNPTKHTTRQQGRGDSVLNSLKAPQPGNLEDAFQKLHIFNDDSESDVPPAKGPRKPILEPVTPKKTKKTLPASPLKTPKIPKSPWKPEHKEFWDPEVNFAWIDKHAPEKLASPQKTSDPSLSLNAQDVKDKIKRKYGTSPEKRDARKAFDATKEQLAQDFLCELDTRITDGQLARLTKDTGGLHIAWSNTLNTTAGRAHWKCKTQSTRVQRPDGSTGEVTTQQHTASIELASKVLGNESDLLNTVAHEFCHLAVFMLNGKPKAAHGSEFKAWGARCGRVFGDRGIEVTTRHDYDIEFKYIWCCEGCKSEVKRHSRSVDTARQRCGRCRGVLVQVKPTPRRNGGATTLEKDSSSSLTVTAQPAKKMNPWQEFMTTERRVLAQTNPGMPFKEQMALISAKWKELRQKDGKKSGKAIKELQTAVEILKIVEEEDEDDDWGGVKGEV
ncbi:SprT-like family-domain-containing protein, partial [Hypomontagnella monticulosa]